MNTQKSGGNDWGTAKFVTRVEMAAMQFVILSKARESQGGVTKENLQQVFRGNLQMSGDHFDHCLHELVQDGHLKQDGNKYVPTDDGREDVQKLQNIILELPNVVQGGSSGGQKQGMTAQKTAGGQGSSGGNVGGGNVGNQGNVGGFKGATGGQSPSGLGGGSSGMQGNIGTGGSTGQGNTGQTTGNQGDFGRSNRGEADTGEEWNRGTVNKGGATRPSSEDNLGNKGKGGNR